MTGLHRRGTITVLENAYGYQMVVKEGRRLGFIETRLRYDVCHNGCRELQRLSASMGNHLYFLTGYRSLVRYSWQDIEKGEFDKGEVVLERVADFNYRGKEVFVILHNGGLATIADGRTKVLPTLTHVAGIRWSCIAKWSGGYLCAALTEVNGGLLVTTNKGGNIMRRQMAVRLTPNKLTLASSGE